MTNQKKQDDPLIGGSALIAIGIIFIMNIVLGWGVMWPLFIAFGGVMALINFIVTGSDKEGVFTGAAVLFTLAGFFLLFTTGFLDWSDMSWLWPGFMLAPAFGLIVSYCITSDKEKLVPAGVLITLFAVFTTASSLQLWNYWPIILIALGLIIIVLTRSEKKA